MKNASSKKLLRLHTLGILTAAVLGGPHPARAAEEIQFNTDVLDVADRTNIDLSRFARAGYVMPGDYRLTLHVNRAQLADSPD